MTNHGTSQRASLTPTMSIFHCPALVRQARDTCASFFFPRPIKIQLPDASASSDSRINPVVVTLLLSG